MTYLPVLIVAAVAMAAASAPSDPLTVCRVMEVPARLAGQRITIEGYVIVGNHGVHLLEPGCAYEINLVDSEADYPGRRAFRRLVEELRGERTMVRLRVTGDFVEPRASEGQGFDDIFRSLVGPYLDLAEVEVIVAERLSRRDARRYQDWLHEPGDGPFRPGRRSMRGTGGPSR